MRFDAGWKACLLAGVLACSVAIAWAGEAQPAAVDPVLEQRVTALGEQLRCLVCQNQNIADSHADLAVDLKNQIREKLAAGQSEREIVDYMVARYGDFVLYKPPLKTSTVLLWAGPFSLMALGLALLGMRIRRRRSEVAAADALDDTARARARALLATPPEDRS